MWLHLDSCQVGYLMVELPASSDIVGYMLYRFKHRPKFVYVSHGQENHSTVEIRFTNLDWTRAAYGRTDYSLYTELPLRPVNFEEILSLARSLSKGMTFVRVDFFEYRGKPRFQS